MIKFFNTTAGKKAKQEWRLYFGRFSNIGAAFIAYAIKRAFFTSFHDKCYEEMESRGHAVFGMCSGQMGGDYETEYLSYSCLDCPYFNISIHKKGKK